MSVPHIAWESVGEGPPLLLIHGLGYTRHGWGPARGLLAERFRVISCDNRGIGESDVPAGPYTAAELAADTLRVLDEAGVERANVVGTSLGGMVAQELALVAPERVERLVLACTTAGGAGAYPLPQRTVDLFTVFPTLPFEEGLRLMVRNALADATAESRPALVDEIYAYRLANQPPLPGWQAQAAAGAAFDGSTRLGEIGMPTLVLHGTADNVVDHRNAEILAREIPGARLEWFEGCGHLFFWEEPERFARVVTEFLA